ncbi:hypothetical protein E3O19_16835 [Cryobacterium algoritolerans]|uniref:Uncharacterized protein n=1 Tax=Cryobacterium algoritolerans TaxID=1259184 RepID=A0A4R8WKJ8_9MICO|nr:hypothetical protein [Cryobacterium algoritolerans]TFC09461.1 hypothetical protein E3O19_16835 [Cryobacterium algoritolerans]
MTSTGRLWITFVAMGADTIHLAVGASATVLLGIVMVGFGVAELGRGVATLVRGRLVAPDLALFGAHTVPRGSHGSIHRLAARV